MNSNIATCLEAEGVLVASIDMPGRSMNVFSDALMDALETLLDDVDARPEIRAVILRSGKPAFLAGADLVMVQQYTETARSGTDAELHALCGRLGRLFRRLETSSKPFIAAVDGLALGGGLELALACHVRIVTDAPHTKLGVPEIKLGLLPGAGGTQRLPRLAGARAALALLWGGESIDARQAAGLGLAHEVVPAGELLTAATRWALSQAGARAQAPWDRTDWAPPADRYDLTGPHALSHAARDAGIGGETLAHYPAYATIFAAVAGGWSLPMDEACSWEMQCFVELIKNPVAGNMVRGLFLDRQRAVKLLGRGGTDRPRRVLTDGPIAALQAAAESASIAVDAAPGNRGVRVCTRPGACAPNSLVWLRGTSHSPADSDTGCGIWLTDSNAQGRALEICRAGTTPQDGGALDIARWLQAVPLFTRERSLFQALESARAACTGCDADDELLALALTAARLWRAGVIEATDLADAALIAGGFAPAHTGGLFTYLRQEGLSRVRARCAAMQTGARLLFELPSGCDALFADEPA